MITLVKMGNTLNALNSSLHSIKAPLYEHPQPIIITETVTNKLKRLKTINYFPLACL